MAHWTPSPWGITHFCSIHSCSRGKMAKHWVPRLGRGVRGLFRLTHPLTPCHRRWALLAFQPWDSDMRITVT